MRLVGLPALGCGVAVAKMALTALLPVAVAGYDATLDGPSEAVAR